MRKQQAREVERISSSNSRQTVQPLGLVLGPPKSRAGRRMVSLPPFVVEVVRDHLAAEVDDNPEAFVFTTESGRPIWRGNLNKLIN